MTSLVNYTGYITIQYAESNSNILSDTTPALALSYSFENSSV